MSRIRDGAQALIDWYEKYEPSSNHAKCAAAQSRRVLLLDDVCKILLSAIEIGQRDVETLEGLYEDGKQAESLIRQATELYRQAEEE